MLLMISNPKKILKNSKNYIGFRLYTKNPPENETLSSHPDSLLNENPHTKSIP